MSVGFLSYFCSDSECFQIQEPDRVLLLFHIPAELPKPSSTRTSSSHHSYSLYPFLSHQPLPWTIGTNSVFRIRRVGEWSGQASYEDIRQTGGLEKGAGKCFTVAQYVNTASRILLIIN
jgi:hypothetical protein